VTRVNGITPAGAANRPKTTATRPGPGFSVESEDAAPSVEAKQPTQGVALSGMLALQETETETVQDRTARRHGIALLETLSQLQKTLLSPQGSAETEIETLALLANEMPHAANPGLAAALADIRLRAKIELLRRGIEII
jgi:hypothetical protein